MDLICPLCNGLYKINIICPLCFSSMKDSGPVVNYLDDYSPYLLDDITSKVDGVSSNKCVHLFKCSRCKYDKKVEIERTCF